MDNQETHQKCKKCGQIKLIDEYYLKNKRTGCRRLQCKKCYNEGRKITAAAHYQANKTIISSRHKKWFETNREYMKERRHQRYINTKDIVNEQGKVYQRSRRAIDINYRVGCVLRSRVGTAVRDHHTHKAARTFELLGCSSRDLRLYLEERFYNEMTWDKLGVGPGTFQIDHIEPVALFDLTDPEQQRKCFHYTNLQPLWWDDHQAKTLEDNRRIREKKATKKHLQ